MQFHYSLIFTRHTFSLNSSISICPNLISPTKFYFEVIYILGRVALISHIICETLESFYTREANECGKNAYWGNGGCLKEDRIIKRTLVKRHGIMLLKKVWQYQLRKNDKKSHYGNLFAKRIFQNFGVWVICGVRGYFKRTHMPFYFLDPSMT
jgi:hypothetical protein